MKSNRIRAANVLAWENSRSIALRRSKATKKSAETHDTNRLFEGTRAITPETSESSLHLKTGDPVEGASTVDAKRCHEIEAIFETQQNRRDPERPAEQNVEVTDKGKPTHAFDSKANRKQVTMGYIEKELVFRPDPVEPLCFVLRRGLWKTPHPSEEGEAVRETASSLVRAGQRSVRDSGPEPGHEAAPSLKWFALYTTSRHEKRVALHLSQRQIDCYLPLYRSERRWSDGSRVTLDLPLFPGYLFIRIPRSERGRVLAVPGALSVVGGTGGEPAPLPDATIEALRAGLKLRPAQPHPLMTAGQKVRIRSGALSGFEGVVVRSKNGFRVVLTLEHIMQSYAVEVDLEDLEPLTPGNPTWAAIPEVEVSQSRV